ncbi:septum formation family protein [Actinoplanes sp. KI2]|uniref:septum formation family protein n=1 Tax=Actinoplanes sp. KI2 TaxID=2983315 RepID=UPI0021D5940E|nr:septum formation family protein [Actinoplanes sp. KI2]MCU7722406.1 septum formation family protein [Actinoplanes sp. KI2]
MRVRRWILAALCPTLLAACGMPGGVDGDLTNGWGAMEPATGFQPAAGTCHGANFDPVGSRWTYEDVDCKQQHRTETVYVGTYNSPAADAAEPPAAGSDAAKAEYRICDRQTTTYLGGPWRTARIWIGVTRPTAAAWTGGARWFRCEALELSSVEDNGVLVQRTGTLRNALAGGPSDLRLTCYAVATDSSGAIAGMPGVGCSAKHNAEFAGVWYAKGLAYPKDAKAWSTFHDGCRAVVASYVKVPNDKDLQYRTGVISLPGSAEVWQAGDHGVRCYLWMDGAELTSSLQGKGAKSLPVQYK